MPDSSEPATLNPRQRLAEELMASASREELVQCVRLLALNVAHYERRYGECLLNQTIEIAGAERPRPETARLWNHGMQTLIGLLTQVCGSGEPPDPAR